MQKILPKDFKLTTEYTVYYCGADWCGPCKRVQPFIIDIAEKYPDTPFFKIDFTDRTLAAECPKILATKVRGIPTILVVENNEIIHCVPFREEVFTNIMAKKSVEYTDKEQIFNKIKDLPDTHIEINSNLPVVKVSLSDDDLKKLGIFGKVDHDNIYYFKAASEIYEILPESIIKIDDPNL